MMSDIFVIIGVISIALSAIGKAVCDSISHHFYESIFKDMDENFWNPVKSGNNKWRNGDRSQGEKFLFSSTLFVSFTEGWHVFDFVRNKFSIIGSLLLCCSMELTIVSMLMLSIYIFFLFSIFFEITYRLLTPGVEHVNYLKWLKKLKIRK